ncbi:hypothetical protein IWZ00DRAFT_496360 [Phyllosticta capitalensis]
MEGCRSREQVFLRVFVAMAPLCQSTCCRTSKDANKVGLESSGPLSSALGRTKSVRSKLVWLSQLRGFSNVPDQ